MLSPGALPVHIMKMKNTQLKHLLEVIRQGIADCVRIRHWSYRKARIAGAPHKIDPGSLPGAGATFALHDYYHERHYTYRSIVEMLDTLHPREIHKLTTTPAKVGDMIAIMAKSPLSGANRDNHTTYIVTTKDRDNIGFTLTDNRLYVCFESELKQESLGSERIQLNPFDSGEGVGDPDWDIVIDRKGNTK